MQSVYLIPDGPKNLASLFPTVDFNTVSDYYVQVLDEDGDVVATSTINCLCKCEGVRLHFLNYLGNYDAVNFLIPKVVHEDSSSEFKNGLSYPLAKTDTGTERFNVNSTDTWEATRKCKETEMSWLQELADTPKMFMEWTGIEGQPDGYIPVVKIAGKFDKVKNDKEYDYEFVIQFKLANGFVTVRN